jgi:predicted nucleotidyltransferase
MEPAETAITRRSNEVAAVIRRISASGAPNEALAVFLYGSALDRLFRLDSDLDVAVLDSSERPLDWAGQAKLMDSLERATGRGIDLRLLRESSLSHQAHVIEHGRLVWTRDQDAVERYSRAVLTAAREAREGSGSRWSQTLDRLAKTAAAN